MKNINFTTSNNVSISSFFQILKFALVCSSLFILLSGCSRKKAEDNLVSIRLVHSPEVATYLQAMKAEFEKTEPKLPGNISLRVDLVQADSVTAAKKIARGEFKTEAWLSSSSSLVNFVNSNIINLGARQIDCRQLFGSPVVIAVQPRFLPVFGEMNRNFSWNDFFERAIAHIDKKAALESTVSYGVGMAAHSITGLPVLIQMTYFAAGHVDSGIDLNVIKSPEFSERFKKYIGAISQYSSQDEVLLDRASNPDSTRTVFALTTEQQMVRFNRTKPADKAALVALYPSEGSYWQDYSLCLSDADWVTAPQRAGVKLFVQFLAGQFAQNEVVGSGFRPMAIELQKPIAPLTEQNGVYLDATKGSRLPIGGDVLTYLFDHWNDFVRPAFHTIVLDTSGTTEGATIASGMKFARTLIAGMKPNDQAAIVIFSDRAAVLVPATADKSVLIRALDGLQASGGSAIYQGVATALDLATNEKFTSYRKNIYLFTDGKDNKSTMSLADLVDSIKDKQRYYDINMQVIAVEGSGVDFSDVAKIVQAFGGGMRLTSSFEVDRAITEVLSVNW